MDYSTPTQIMARHRAVFRQMQAQVPSADEVAAMMAISLPAMPNMAMVAQVVNRNRSIQEGVARAIKSSTVNTDAITANWKRLDTQFKAISGACQSALLVSDAIRPVLDMGDMRWRDGSAIYHARADQRCHACGHLV